MALHHRLKNALKATAGMRMVSFFDFDLFAPYSRGPNRQKTDHAILGAQIIFPMMAEFADRQGISLLPVVSAENFGADTRDTAMALKILLDQHGSDKANKHNYHFVLGRILHQRDAIKGVLEVGLGSNNPKIVSNMTVHGKPGASVRAFRDFLPQAHVYGADYDRGALFTEDRLTTYHVDQTDPHSFDALGAAITHDLDLVIDDGLHSPTANLTTLEFGLSRLALGGWVVVEDINPLAVPLWQMVALLLNARYSPHLIQCTKNPIFAVQRIG
ncbi:MAG: hypothetical protein Q7J57_11195 [Gemmobacter sp.]|nr:hypothetical protein [Gemmobacter sp.]